MDFVTIMSFISCAILAAVSVILWRKASGYHHFLQEAANRFEESRKHNNDLKEQCHSLKNELDEMRLVARRLEQKNAELQGKNTQLMTEYKKLESFPIVDVDALENNIENLTAQNATLIQHPDVLTASGMINSRKNSR